jgi:hypothetical protein
MLRAIGALVAIAAVGALLTACSGSKTPGTNVSVFDIKVGDCFNAPGEVQAELSKIKRVPCAAQHVREAYAITDYAAPSGATSSDAYPGADVLSVFAKGACAQQYKPYVGVDYLDSSLFFTYLFPSARSWEQDDDRKVICFVTTTGAPLTGSVKGSMK